jgi:hypothetical protein
MWRGGGKSLLLDSEYELIHIRDNIYKIIVRGETECVKFFYKTDEFEKVFIKFSDTQYILANYNNTPILKDDVYTECNVYLSQLSENTQFKLHYNIQHKNFLKEQKVGYISLLSFECFENVDLTRAKSQITRLNDVLILKCKLSLELDYFFNLHGKISKFTKYIPSLTLCLYSESECISSLELIINNDSLTINSKTDKNHEGKKYNKLLRSVAIIISKYLSDKILRIESDAINPISAWLMISEFNAIINNNDDNILFYKFLETQKIKIDFSNKETLKSTITEFYEKNPLSSICSSVNLDQVNIENAQNVFNRVIETEIICDPSDTGDLLSTAHLGGIPGARGVKL